MSVFAIETLDWVSKGLPGPNVTIANRVTLCKMNFNTLKNVYSVSGVTWSESGCPILQNTVFRVPLIYKLSVADVRFCLKFLQRR